MAAIVVAGTTSRAAANTGQLSTPLPDGAAAGDLLVLIDGTNDAPSPPVFTEPVNPTVLQAGTFGTSGIAPDAYGAVHRALLTPTDVTNGDVAFNTSATYAAARLVVGAVLYRGHDATNPIAASATSVQTVTTDTHATPDLVLPTSTTDRTVRLVHLVIEKSAVNDAWVVPAGLTKRATAYSLNVGGCSVVVADSTDVLVPANSALAQRTFTGKPFRTTKAGAAATTGKARMVQVAVLAAADSAGISPNTAAAYPGTRIELIGVGHLDPSFTYLWEQTEGDPAVIGNPTAANAYYLRPYKLRKRQVFRFTITGNGTSRSTVVTIPGNREIEARVEDSNGTYS